MTRPRQPSSPGGYRTVVEQGPQLVSAPPPRGPTLETRVAVIEQKLDTLEEQSEKRHADVLERLTKGEQSSRSETTKIIAAAVVSVVTAVFGARVTAPAPDPTPPVVHKSELTIKLESCEKLQDGVERARCISAIAAQSAAAPSR